MRRAYQHPYIHKLNPDVIRYRYAEDAALPPACSDPSEPSTGFAEFRSGIACQQVFEDDNSQSLEVRTRIDLFLVETHASFLAVLLPNYTTIVC